MAEGCGQGAIGLALRVALRLELYWCHIQELEKTRPSCIQPQLVESARIRSQGSRSKSQEDRKTRRRNLWEGSARRSSPHQGYIPSSTLQFRLMDWRDAAKADGAKPLKA